MTTQGPGEALPPPTSATSWTFIAFITQENIHERLSRSSCLPSSAFHLVHMEKLSPGRLASLKLGEVGMRQHF